MDTLHSGIFYAFAAVTVAGGLLTGLAGGRLRPLGVALVAVGLAGLEADLDAGLVALVTLAALGTTALVLLRPGGVRSDADQERGGLVRQLGAALAGAVFLVLAYVAFKGGYFAGHHPGGFVNSAALGRLLVGRDAIVVEAAAASLLVGVAALGLVPRTRTR